MNMKLESPIHTTSPRALTNEARIEIPEDILGSARVLLSVPNAPIVFLMDEYHKDDSSTDQNIANACQLVEKANVTLIGVESHTGGREWNDYEGKPSNDFDLGDSIVPVNDWPRFADAMRSSKAKVLGVECAGMMRQQETECSLNGTAIKAHKLNQERSEHFIRTLLELRSRDGLGGNLILNAGAEHQCHVEKWVEDGTIEERVGLTASYVRIRVPTYPG